MMEYQVTTIPNNVLPSATTLHNARSKIHTFLPSAPLGTAATTSHLEHELVPGFSQSSQSSRYYGFVTGGSTPIASFADNLVTQYDQNVQVHLPNETIATDVEYHALNMLCELIDLDFKQWPHKTFTTGATGANIVGLACGREYVVRKAGEQRNVHDVSIAKLGLLAACTKSGVNEIRILTTVPHSSIKKAASTLGLGHTSVIDCSSATHPYKFDLGSLDAKLKEEATANIIMISACEVNSGMFATSSLSEMQEIRALADKHHAWIHIDAAMGFMARLLPSTPEYDFLKTCSAGLELADSITGDGHKLLNVPYDTGFIFSKRLDIATSVFQNPGAAYLSAAAGDQIPSPLHIGLENSRRFRALPVYANLVAYGKQGYQDMIVRQVMLARRIAVYLYESPHYEVYTPPGAEEGTLEHVFMITLFRAKDEEVNEVLVKRINETRRIYCSGTMWEGRKACRFAVANWKADVERDWEVVEGVLEEVVGGK
jgi:glutamate/tyrosine decarboxylase-like PLP-dependent enzyme